ncbi:MAG: IS200/IS605 family transposase [Ardenticatenaceae bacterium]
MGQTYCCSRLHFIWSTKGREPWIDPEWRDDLYSYMGGILRKKDAVLLCAGGMPDHVHLYASVSTKFSYAKLVNAVKSNSSTWVHETFPHLQDFKWQGGYAVFGVSLSVEDQVKEYIGNQEKHHNKNYTFKKELILFLEKHGVDYDERYIFD